VSFSLHGCTQGALIEALERECGARDALVYPDRGLRWSFSDLGARSLELARGLCALGVQPGDHVTLWSDNRPDWIAFQFALARIGAVLVTANVSLTQPEIGYLLRQSRSVVVVAAPGRKGEEYLDALAALRSDPAAVPALRKVVVLDGPVPDGMIGIDELVRSGASVSEGEVFDRTRSTPPSAPANIQYTSGTTGFPKGVVLTHQNLVENAWAGAQANQARVGDRYLLMVPLFHCFGCCVVVLGAYTHGLPLVAVQTFDPARVLGAIEAEGVTLIHGVPAMFSALLDHPDRLTRNLSSLRAGLVAGALCPEPLMRRIHDELDVGGISAAYGLTEASPGVSLSEVSAPLEQRLGTVGKPYTNISVRIVDPGTLEDVPSDGVGEIWVQGPNVMLGYFNDEEATRVAITEDHWLRTGDLGSFDGDGALTIRGRIKELVIRGGENVFPGEVEDVLRTHEHIRDASVFGVSDPRLGEEVAAAIISEPGEQIRVEALESWLETRLAVFKRPRRWIFVDAFPMTASGKVQKFRLQEMCGGEG